MRGFELLEAVALRKRLSQRQLWLYYIAVFIIYRVALHVSFVRDTEGLQLHLKLEAEEVLVKARGRWEKASATLL